MATFQFLKIWYFIRAPKLESGGYGCHKNGPSKGHHPLNLLSSSSFSLGRRLLLAHSPGEEGCLFFFSFPLEALMGSTEVHTLGVF